MDKIGNVGDVYVPMHWLATQYFEHAKSRPSQLTDASLDISVRQSPRMESIVDILAAWEPEGVSLIVYRVCQQSDEKRTWWIDTADKQISQILSSLPCFTRVALWRYDPIRAFAGQAVQDGFTERPIWHIMLEKQTLNLGLLRLDFSKRAHKMTLWMPAGRLP
jgi:hypothetical protein